MRRGIAAFVVGPLAMAVALVAPGVIPGVIPGAWAQALTSSADQGPSLPAALPPQILAPEGSERVAAVVNQDAVTFYDLAQRVGLAILSAAQQDTPELRAQIRPQMLRRLIDEHLETQDAQKNKVFVPDQQVDDAAAGVARQNNMQPEQLAQLLAGRSVNIQTLRSQIKAQLIWNALLRQQLLPKIQIGDSEIDARLAQLKANEGKPEYLGADIFLPIDEPNRAAEVVALGNRIRDQLARGAPFIGLAQQFSQYAPTSGGDMGWVSPGMIDAQLIDALANMPVNTPSQPIRASDGIHILYLRGKRIAGEGTDNQATYDLAQIDIVTLPSAPEVEVNRAILGAKTVLSAATSCDDYAALTRKLPSANFQRLGTDTEDEIPPSLLAVIKPLKPGGMTDVINSGTLHRFYIECSYTPASKGLPSRDDLKRALTAERMDTLSEGYLRDLRRSGFVEIRS